MIGTVTNREAAMRYLWQNGDAPRVLLAKTLGITKAAVTQLTSELLEQGILIEKGELMDSTGKQPRGRRKILVGINENYKLVAGFVLSSEGLCAGLCNLKGGILSKLIIPIKEKNHHAILELMSDSLSRLLKENCIPSNRLLGVGAAIYGDCSFVEGVTPVEKGKRLCRELAHGVGMRVIYTPLAAGGILAQRLFCDTTQRTESTLIILVTEGYKIETGVYINGAIYSGKHSGAGGERILGVAPVLLEEADLLASQILSLVQSLDPEGLITYLDLPSYLDVCTQLKSELTRQINREATITESLLTKETLFLSPAAAALDKLLFS